MNENVNDLAYWFPKIEPSLPVPQTNIVQTTVNLTTLLDGVTPEDFGLFAAQLHTAAHQIGYPLFMRTGYTSGKHEWRNTCYVATKDDLLAHVAALVEHSHLVDIFGLPTDTWVVRELIPAKPLFYAFEGMPITREFRFFVTERGHVRWWQPYWPEGAIRYPEPVPGRDDERDWEDLLRAASELTEGEYADLSHLARAAQRLVGHGAWSVDILQDRVGNWWVTDMADAERSFMYDPTTGGELDW